MGPYLGSERGPDGVLISVLPGKSVREESLGEGGLPAALLPQQDNLQLDVGHQESEDAQRLAFW
jgi:hypothetical protein